MIIMRLEILFFLTLSKNKGSKSAKILYEQRKNNAKLHLLEGKGHREAFWAEETPALISNWLQYI